MQRARHSRCRPISTGSSRSSARIRAAQAEQLRLVERAHGYAHAVEGVHAGSSAGQREFATRSFLAELATALVVPEGTAGALVADAATARRHPATLEALRAGAISLPQLRSIFEAITGLPRRCRRRARGSGTRAGTAADQRRAASTAAIACANGCTPSHSSCGIAPPPSIGGWCSSRPPDGMAWLSLFLQAEHAVAITHRLDRLLDEPSETAPIVDHRTRAQRVLDAAAELLLAGVRTDRDGEPIEGDSAIVPRVLVTVPVLTLLGHTDEPAELDGYGPIDADTARRLAAHAPSFQRILTHPETGAFLSYSRTTYRVPADLAGYLRTRDGTCRFPGCGRRATGCDIDHTTDWGRDGHTRHDNLAHLCRKHHRLKHGTRWRMSQDAHGVIRWTSPAGREHTTHPENPFVVPSASRLRQSRSMHVARRQSRDAVTPAARRAGAPLTPGMPAGDRAALSPPAPRAAHCRVRCAGRARSVRSAC